MADTPRVAVIIPAHNEATVLPATLGSLAGQDGIDQVAVVVVPNGCSDDTEAVARSFAGRLPGLRVIPVAAASKPNALNAGDRAAPPGARIYLDADIVLRPGLLRAMVAALDTPAPVLVCPRVEFDTAGATALPRAFYDVFARIQHANDTMTSGLYGVSAAGRARFGTFPELVADDTFVKRLFEPGERVDLDERFVVQAPRDSAGLLRMRTRVARGNQELAGLAGPHAPTTRQTARTLAALVRGDPGLAAKAAVYAGVVLAARLRARRSAGRPDRGWERDESTRAVPARAGADR